MRMACVNVLFDCYQPSGLALISYLGLMFQQSIPTIETLKPSIKSSAQNNNLPLKALENARNLNSRRPKVNSQAHRVTSPKRETAVIKEMVTINLVISHTSLEAAGIGGLGGSN
jgi:hypothetical protein